MRRWKHGLATLALTAVVASAGVLGSGTMAGARNIGNEGCTPGYWKNHTDNWEEYQPTQTVSELFPAVAGYPSLANLTLLQALGGGGGTGTEGAARILLRAGVAAFLNAAHEGLGYPFRRFGNPGQLSVSINDALASGDRQTMLDLATHLDEANNLGCPLN